MKDQLRQILEGSRAAISTIKPSDWVEANLVMRKPFPGPFRYDRTPYTREIIDCLDPNHPAKWIAFMKGAQIGASAGVIIPGIGWIIANNPANTYLTVGSTPLIEKAMQKVDMMLKDSGIHHLIGPTVQRRKNQKSGDTNTVKEFAGGAMWVSTPNNHEAIRQIDLQYGFIDDAEAIKQASEKAGDTTTVTPGFRFRKRSCSKQRKRLVAELVWLTHMGHPLKTPSAKPSSKHRRRQGTPFSCWKRGFRHILTVKRYSIYRHQSSQPVLSLSRSSKWATSAITTYPAHAANQPSC